MAILKRTYVETADYVPKNIFYNREVYEEGCTIAKDFNGNIRVSERVFSYIDELYQMEQMAESYLEANDFSFDSAILSEPLASEIVFYISGILDNISGLREKDWKILVRKRIGQLTPDIVITEKEATPTEEGFQRGVIAVIELRNEAWVRQLIAKKNPTYFQKYTDTLGVTLKDIFIIIPTLVTYPNSMKSVVEEQGIFSQSTGLPKENWVILSENRSISNEESQMFLTINFDDFLKELVAR
ncbi:hypothetical protein [Capnocytophaga granulosa]|uniref:hypothetical protein n=1 Tax=Capnocytophaga granulosa TaxID=45242 RepID=UPI003C71A5CB